MDTYIAIDLETTGLSPKMDRILEVGAVRVENDGITEQLQLFVDPGRAIPARITELTGITGEMLEGAASQEEAIRRVIDFCGDAPLLGHNILFDYSFLKRSAVNCRLSFERSGIDTLKLARKFLPDMESRRLGCLCEYYHIETGRQHRAVDDAIAAKCLYDCLKREFYAGNEDAFRPGPLNFAVKREGPITEAQKRYLNDLIKYHKIETDYVVEKLTKNEASRRIDQILSSCGRIR